jgi:hypothetical protein
MYYNKKLNKMSMVNVMSNHLENYPTPANLTYL